MFTELCFSHGHRRAHQPRAAVARVAALVRVILPPAASNGHGWPRDLEAFSSKLAAPCDYGAQGH